MSMPGVAITMIVMGILCLAGAPWLSHIMPYGMNSHMWDGPGRVLLWIGYAGMGVCGIVAGLVMLISPPRSVILLLVTFTAVVGGGAGAAGMLARLLAHDEMRARKRARSHRNKMRDKGAN